MPSPASTQLTWQIDTQGRLVTPEQFGEIIVRTGPDSAMLRLKDVARVELGGQDYSVSSRANGHGGAHGRGLSAARRQRHRHRRPWSRQNCKRSPRPCPTAWNTGS